MSQQNQLAEAILGLLEGVTLANGFRTDAGLHAWRGKTYGIDPDEHLPCLVLFEDEETVKKQEGAAIHARCPFVVEATGPCDLDHPNRAAQALADDVCQALFPEQLPESVRSLIAGNKRFSYAGRQIVPRKEGQAFITVNVKFEAFLIFTLGQ